MKTATSALEKVEGLIEVATQRLIPQALQRLSVTEILGEHVIRKASLLGIPTKDDLGITAESDVAYNRLVKFLRLHEPTGHERDVAHKHDVVRFLNLKQMLHECQQAMVYHKSKPHLEREKDREVRGKLHSWSMNKSRDESEYLRKREAMQLAAGLDRLVDGQLETINQPRRRHLEKKKQEWQALQQAVPSSVVADVPDQVQTKLSVANESEDGGSTPVRPSSGALHSVKKKKSTSGGAGTPVGSGGMHFRNQLPPNYTPQSKRSNGTPTSFSSKEGSSTPSTPLSTSSSGKLQLLDEAAARAESRALGRIRSSESTFGGDESPAVHDEDDERGEGAFQSPSLRFSERVQESRPELTFQSFHATTHTNQGSLPLARVASATALNRKLFPRGTVPPQTEPLDPEYRHLYSATISRKPPLPTNILPDKPLGQSRNVRNTATIGNNQHESSRASSASVAVKNATASTMVLLSSGSSQMLSDFRAEQMQEVERIRILFEQHKLAIPTSIVERGLLLPEDRSTYECVHNLPIPGSRLVSNPLLQVRVKAKATKKKKKKKGGKAGTKKTKGKNSAGDKSKSPTKKKR